MDLSREASKFCVSRVILEKSWGSVQFRGEVTSFRKVSDTKGMYVMDRRSVWNDWKSRLEASQGFISTCHSFEFIEGEWGKSCVERDIRIVRELSQVGIRSVHLVFSDLENVDTISWFFVSNHSVRLTYPVPVSRVYYLS